MKRLKTVFHIHTDHSNDCDRSGDSYWSWPVGGNIDCMAITDHDTISGAGRWRPPLTATCG